MKEQRVEFFSEGARLAGILRTPDEVGGPMPALVQGPGWLGLKDAQLYLPYHEALTAAGFAVLIFDYRGFGDSEPGPKALSPNQQYEDLVNAVSWLTTRDDVDADAIGAFGSGGTGGGNAVLLAADDVRVKAAVAQVPVADGRDWLHRMRTEYEWLDFMNALEEDRRERTRTGVGATVHPREGIMVPTPERRATNVKKDVDSRIPNEVELACAWEILDYRPVEAAARCTAPLMVIGVEGDATTPTDHAEAIVAAAAGPSRLVMQRDTTHYAAYKRYGDTVIPEIVDWLTTHVRPAQVIVTDSGGADHPASTRHIAGV